MRTLAEIYESGADVIHELETQLAEVNKRADKMGVALRECREYFDQRADLHADNENAGNEEMTLLVEIDEALRQDNAEKDE